MAVHAMHPTLSAEVTPALCVYYFKSWKGKLGPSERTTIRYQLVSCKLCIRVFQARPQLANLAYMVERERGETGTLDATAGDAEARRYWRDVQSRGGYMPPWARILYGEKEG